jgi:RNA polymerase sigma-70 factor, ECF subfamily
MAIDEKTHFSADIERHRGELQVHCYRMLGSFDESEDLVQETMLRAWRWRDTFENRGPGSLRAWLYRIATNACLDAIARRPRRVLASQLGPPHDPAEEPPPPADLAFLQPYPDRLLEAIAPPEDQPDAALVRRETIEIAFLATLQLLPARQRAVLIVRDVLGWSAKETAELLDTSVASVNSALQRARAGLDEHLPRREEWPAEPDPGEERAVLDRYVDALLRGDVGDVAVLLAEDVRADMPPHPFWFSGREDNIRAMTPGFDETSEYYMGDWKAVESAANLSPTAAFYRRKPGETVYEPFALDVLEVRGGKITAITAFDATPEVLRAFELPASL